MTTFYRAVAATLMLLAGLAAEAHAQKKYAPVSHNPVKDAASARTTLFNLSERDSAYYFRADLPGDNFLTIQFGKLSYWQDAALPDIAAAAKLAWTQLQDSFAGETTARRISVHLPASNHPMIAAASEWGTEQRTFLLKNRSVQPIRIAIDTISILKTIAYSGSDTSGKHQILYTFLLKDLGEIEAIAENAALINNVSSTFDSLVAAKRRRWRREDAAYHNLQAQYDVRRGIDKGPKLHTEQPGSVLDNLNYYTEIGVSFVAGSVASYANLRLSYKWQGKNKDLGNRFIAVSCSSIGFADKQNDQLILRGGVFANLELGFAFSDAVSRLPVYRTSVGFGYRIAAQNAGPYNFKYRLFFNYSISKALTITPEAYYLPKPQPESGNGFAGLTIALRLF